MEFLILKGLSRWRKKLHEKQPRLLKDTVIKGTPRSYRNRVSSQNDEFCNFNLFVFYCTTKRATRSAMCGYAVISLGRYFIDSFFKNIILPETKVNIQCPCGPTAYDVLCPQTKYCYTVSYTKRDITLDMIFLFLNFI